MGCMAMLLLLVHLWLQLRNSRWVLCLHTHGDGLALQARMQLRKLGSCTHASTMSAAPAGLALVFQGYSSAIAAAASLPADSLAAITVTSHRWQH